MVNLYQKDELRREKMKNVYITKGNYEYFTKRIPILGENGKKIEYNLIETEIGLGLDKSKYFSDFEKRQMLVIRNVVLHSSEFYSKNKEILEKIYSKESKYKLYNIIPHYHKNKDCEKLKKDYENYKLDENIPDTQLKEYKEWVKERINLLEVNIAFFTKIHIKKWGENIEIPVYEFKKNSEDKEAIGISEIILKIAELSNSFSEVDQIEFKNLACWSYLSMKDDREIYSKRILKYKKELKKLHELKRELLSAMIIESSKVEFNTLFLKLMGFKPCSCCCK